MNPIQITKINIYNGKIISLLITQKSIKTLKKRNHPQATGKKQQADILLKLKKFLNISINTYLYKKLITSRGVVWKKFITMLDHRK